MGKSRFSFGGLVFWFCLISLFLASGLSAVYGLTPAERAELQEIRALLMESRESLSAAEKKLRSSESELQTLAAELTALRQEVVRLESLSAEQGKMLEQLEADYQRQSTELINYWRRREIKTGLISGGIGAGVGFILCLLLLF